MAQPTMSTLATRPLTRDDWPAFEAFFTFGGSTSGCWCMNHRAPMGLDVVGDAARLSMKQLVETGRVYGVLAFAPGDATPIGWCAVDRTDTLPGHDCVGARAGDNPGRYSLHCIVVRSDWRGRGVEVALSDAGIAHAIALGATELEAYPEPDSRVGAPFATWNTFGGFESHFADVGFAPTSHQVEGYRTLRRGKPER